MLSRAWLPDSWCSWPRCAVPCHAVLSSAGAQHHAARFHQVHLQEQSSSPSASAGLQCSRGACIACRSSLAAWHPPDLRWARQGLPGTGTKPFIATCSADTARRRLVKLRVGFCRGTGWVMQCSSPLPAPSSLLSGLAGAGGGLGRGTGVGSTARPHLPIAELQDAPWGIWQGCTKRGKCWSTFIRCGHFVFTV